MVVTPVEQLADAKATFDFLTAALYASAVDPAVPSSANAQAEQTVAVVVGLLQSASALVGAAVDLFADHEVRLAALEAR
jgi:hypothetical protein